LPAALSSVELSMRDFGGCTLLVVSNTMDGNYEAAELLYPSAKSKRRLIFSNALFLRSS
jgi:hypothetical protein